LYDLLRPTDGKAEIIACEGRPQQFVAADAGRPQLVLSTAFGPARLHSAFGQRHCMSKLLLKIADKLILWAARGREVGHLDGIRLADMRNRGDSFCETILNSLRLVQAHDPRRYARLKCFIEWIINQPTTGAVSRYEFSIRACFIEFYDEIPGLTPLGLAGLYATFLVHEATHGLIASRGTGSEGWDRARIERICIEEQNRFASKLIALDPIQYPKQYLLQDSDLSLWERQWRKTRMQKGLSILSRYWKDVARTRRYRQRREALSSRDAARGSRRA
jgi:hypothetical protein